MKQKFAEYLIKKTKENYNLIASDFSRTRGKPWEELNFLLEKYLKEESRVLDLGCGNGRFYPLFKKKSVEYIGADISEKLIEIAKKRYPEANFQTISPFNFNFPNNYFDEVFSIAVFHHIPSEQFRIRFLKEVKRILKDEGILVLTVWKLSLKKEIGLFLKYIYFKLFKKLDIDFRDDFVSWAKKLDRYYHFFSKKELKKLVKKAGFKIIKIGLLKGKRTKRKNIYLVAQNKPS